MLKLMKLLVLSVSFSISSVCSAAELGTSAEAVAMVNKAVAYLAENGREKTIAEMNKPASAFVDRDLYVVAHDMKGVILVNPVLPRMVGKNILEIKDVDGKAFVKDRLAMLAQANSGWNDFKWPNSVTNKVDIRSTYFTRVDDIVFTCGILKK
jgi:signal transduction histidine kinase